MAGEELPKTYKAAVYDQPGKISTKVVEKPIPEPAAGDVLIKLYAPLGHVLCTQREADVAPKHPLRSVPLGSGHHVGVFKEILLLVAKVQGRSGDNTSPVCGLSLYLLPLGTWFCSCH